MLHRLASLLFFTKVFYEVFLQQLDAGAGLAEDSPVTPRILLGLLQKLVALLINDLNCEGHAALPDALQVSKIRWEGLILLNDNLLVVFKVLLLILFGVHIAILLVFPPFRYLPIKVS